MIRLAVLAILSCYPANLTYAGAPFVKKLLVESHEITAGEFRGLNIGKSKDDVLTQIRLINPKARIVPIPDQDFLVSNKNLDELRFANASSGLRVFNYRGISIDVLFKNVRVADLNKSIPASELPWFEIGETRQQVIERTKFLLRDNISLQVIPIVPPPNGGAYALEQLSPSDRAELFSNSSWEFEATSRKALPSGSIS